MNAPSVDHCLPSRTPRRSNLKVPTITWGLVRSISLLPSSGLMPSEPGLLGTLNIPRAKSTKSTDDSIRAETQHHISSHLHRIHDGRSISSQSVIHSSIHPSSPSIKTLPRSPRSRPARRSQHRSPIWATSYRDLYIAGLANMPRACPSSACPSCSSH